MRLSEIGPITIGSRVRDTISCVFLPHAVGVNLVHLRQDTTNRVSLKATTKVPALYKKEHRHGQVSKYPKHANAIKNRVVNLSIALFFIGGGPLVQFRLINLKTCLNST